MKKDGAMEAYIWKGSEVIKHLAGIYSQLYLIPGEEGERLYPEIAQRGREPETRSLSHFHTTGEDTCYFEKTPAGEVQVVTLHDRSDFEVFLKIMGEKCRKVKIPPTQGASILDGVINHQRIRAHKEEFFRTVEEAGNGGLDWFAWEMERSRFLADKSNYQDAIIILSAGPYSGVSADKAGYREKEWLSISQTIRKYHECTHFVCRRLFPKKIDAVWDELVADAVGIYAALGHYEIRLAETVLGIADESYIGGRLENYVPSDVSEKAEYISGLLPQIRRVMETILEHSESRPEAFALAVGLEEQKEALWR